MLSQRTKTTSQRNSCPSFETFASSFEKRQMSLCARTNVNYEIEYRWMEKEERKEKNDRDDDDSKRFGRNGKITKRITATEIKKRTRESSSFGKNGLSRWCIVTGFPFFFFFSTKSNGIAPPAFLENLFAASLSLSPLKPWPLCAALRWILHEGLPPPPPTTLHLFHSPRHFTPRASPGQPTSVAFPPIGKYTRVEANACASTTNSSSLPFPVFPSPVHFSKWKTTRSRTGRGREGGREAKFTIGRSWEIEDERTKTGTTTRDLLTLLADRWEISAPLFFFFSFLLPILLLLRIETREFVVGIGSFPRTGKGRIMHARVDFFRNILGGI